jgi:uncharacterized linocin/CFP29 family protein
MSHLLREFAPITDVAWRGLEEEARRTLEHFLTSRRLVDFDGPLGWEYDAVPSRRTVDLPDSHKGVRARSRVPYPLTELRADFDMPRTALDALSRGAADVDLRPVQDAARQLALAEDTIALGDGSIVDASGLAALSPHTPIPVDDDSRDIPHAVARAIEVLRDAGVGGPYAVALGSNTYTGVMETTEKGGYPVLEHLRLIAGGPVLWAPTVDGAIVCSTRGGDARLTIGQDAALGYIAHDASVVKLYLEETVAFEVLTPEAAIRVASTHA